MASTAGEPDLCIYLSHAVIQATGHIAAAAQPAHNKRQQRRLVLPDPRRQLKLALR